MAGIGLELKKLLLGQTYFSEMKAYVYSAIISSGPWLLSIVTLAVLGMYRGVGTDNIDKEIFRCTVIYSYAFSLIFEGIIQLIATRYLADRFYEKRTDLTLSTFMTCTILLLGAGVVFATFFYSFFDISVIHWYCAVTLFLVITMIWISMVFLSVIKDYKSVFNAFLAGTFLSIFAAIVCGRYFHTEGYIIGYLIGQALTLFWLLARLLSEFPPSGLWDWEFFHYSKKYWELVIIGVLFNLGVWADKFVFWLAPSSRLVVPHYRTHDLYDAPVFFAYLTIVPTLSMFLLKIETLFYDHYRRYYTKVVEKKSMLSILEEKNIMIKTLKESIREIFIIQGSVTLVCIIFSPEIVKLTGLSPLQIPIFQIVLLGSFLNVLFTINVIILFYFDQRKAVLLATFVFCFLNITLSYMTSLMEFKWWGFGYTYACLISLLLAFYLLHIKMRDLEYITFARQPIIH